MIIMQRNIARTCAKYTETFAVLNAICVTKNVQVAENYFYRPLNTLDSECRITERFRLNQTRF